MKKPVLDAVQDDFFVVVAAVLLLPDAESSMSGMFRRSRRRMSSKYTKKYGKSTECFLANANPEYWMYLAKGSCCQK